MKWSIFNILFSSEKLGFCLFNSRMLSLLKIDEDTYTTFSKIRDGVSCPQNVLCDSDYQKLIHSKILVSEHEDENYLNMLKYRNMIKSYTSETLALVICPTLACNFACPYCYEKDLPQKFIKEEMQDEIIKFINKNEIHYKQININWHGGEPLLAFNTIKRIYQKLEDNVKLPIIRTNMVSNGYLLNEDICVFFNKKNLNYLQITIDGNKETHNKTRKLKNGGSSFEKIIENIDMATKLMPNCKIGVRTNIGKDNRDDYVPLYKELKKRWNGTNVNIYHAYVLDNSLNTCKQKRLSIELSTEEKNDFEVMLAQNGIRSKKSLYPKLDCTFHSCMDNNAFVIDPNGFLYKCWADVGIENRSIGTLSTGIKDYRIVSQYMVGTDKFSDKKCLKCGFLPICDGGCNLYRVGKIEKDIPYNVCCINEAGLVKYLETYMERL